MAEALRGAALRGSTVYRLKHATARRVQHTLRFKSKHIQKTHENIQDTFESPFEAMLEAERTGPTGVTGPAFPLFLPRSYLFASGRLGSNHFPAAFHLP